MDVIRLDDKERMGEIISCLEKKFTIQRHRWVNDAFTLLIATILSQNTNDRNSSRAFQALMQRFEVKPKVLAELKPEEIKPFIKCAGLYEVRSRRIVVISKEVLQRFNGNLDDVLKLPLPEARRTLMSLGGVGPKTADILLNFLGDKAVMPIDTNIFRVVNRIGLVKGRNYERTRAVLEKLIPPEKLREMHLLLIKLGREICRPRKPVCTICPINGLCDFDRGEEFNSRL
jgi:endonuclease-3